MSNALIAPLATPSLALAPLPPAVRNPLATLRRRSVRAWAFIGWLSLLLLLIGNAMLGTGIAVRCC
jgi:hypothetical protein